MARPSKLNEELIDELCEWVATDTPFRYCAEGCGVLYDTFMYWMRKGEQDILIESDTLEAELFNRIKKTYAKVVRNSVSKIKEGEKNWQGECWIRQRRDNEFMDRQELNTNGEKVIVQLGNSKGKHGVKPV